MKRILILWWLSGTFKEQQNLNVNDFNGVSIIKFSADGKISSIKEFESKSEHSAPYHSS